jgi:predicted nucleic acid-binding protein
VAGLVSPSLLLDTSVVIADAPSLEPVEGTQAAISVLTIGELRAGVSLAREPRTRAGRQARLAAVRAAFQALVIDEQIAERYGELLALARANRRATKASDLLIVATAAATGRELLTRDQGQAALAHLAGVPCASEAGG